jgi:hypothetical protein
MLGISLPEEGAKPLESKSQKTQAAYARHASVASKPSNATATTEVGDSDLAPTETSSVDDVPVIHQSSSDPKFQECTALLRAAKKKGCRFVSADLGVHALAVGVRVSEKRSWQSGSSMLNGEHQEDRNVERYASDKTLTTTITAKSVKHDSGAPAKAAAQEILLEGYRKMNPKFKQAELDVTNHSTKTSKFDDLLKAITLKAQHFEVLYSFYGQNRFALTRFNNRIGMSRALDRAAFKLLPEPNDVLVCGVDFKKKKTETLPQHAESNSRLNGLLKSCSALGRQIIILPTEFRSSALDAASRMYSEKPVGQESKKKVQEREEREERKEAKEKKEKEEKEKTGSSDSIEVNDSSSSSSSNTTSGSGSGSDRTEKSSSSSLGGVNSKPSASEGSSKKKRKSKAKGGGTSGSSSSGFNQSAAQGKVGSEAMDVESDGEGDENNGRRSTKNCIEKGGVVSSSSTSSVAAQGSVVEGKGKGGGRKKRENKASNRGKVITIYGLYLHASGGRSNLMNRDCNASVNLAQFVNSLIATGNVPYEFREEVNLREEEDCASRTFSYKAHRTNRHGQIIKFKRRDDEN